MKRRKREYSAAAAAYVSTFFYLNARQPKENAVSVLLLPQKKKSAKTALTFYTFQNNLYLGGSTMIMMIMCRMPFGICINDSENLALAWSFLFPISSLHFSTPNHILFGFREKKISNAKRDRKKRNPTRLSPKKHKSKYWRTSRNEYPKTGAKNWKKFIYIKYYHMWLEFLIPHYHYYSEFLPLLLLQPLLVFLCRVVAVTVSLTSLHQFLSLSL